MKDGHEQSVLGPESAKVIEANNRLVNVGALVPIKTLMEIRAATETIEVYTVSVPAKKANVVVNALKKILPPNTRTGMDLQHFRRLVKEDHLSDHIRERIRTTALANTLAVKIDLGVIPEVKGKENLPLSRRRRPSATTQSSSRGGSKCLSFSSTPNSGSSAATEENTTKRRSPRNPLLHLIIAPTCHTTITTLYFTLQPLLLSVEISTLSVPLFAPISQEQAEKWTEKYWPTIYKRGNPFGPHPPMVDQTSKRIFPKVSQYMAVARQAAKECFLGCAGFEIGCVIVSPDNEEVVTVAGDARHKPWGVDWGNPLDHAVLRAIGFVATKRKLRDKISSGALEGVYESERYSPITEVEKKYFYNLTKSETEHEILEPKTVPNGECDPEEVTGKGVGKREAAPEGNKTGYLCHNHIAYVTHEPCIMCSMALVHSRVSLVVLAGANKSSKPGMGGFCSGLHRSSANSSPAPPTFRQLRDSVATSPANGSNYGGEYGLFWRKELNWKFLVFEYREDQEEYLGRTEKPTQEAVSLMPWPQGFEQNIGRDVHA